MAGNHSTKRAKSNGEKAAMAMIAKLEAEKEPVLSEKTLCEIEAFVSESVRERRAALAFLTKPWCEMEKMFREDRGAAVLFAEVAECIRGKAQKYGDLADLMRSADVRIQLALCGRPDMAEILKEANATVG